MEPDLPGWAERFYFNLLRSSGEIAAVLGGGVYPVRGVSECYFCHLEGERQLNVRVWNELPGAGAEAVPAPFSFRCDTPLQDWTVGVDVEGARFEGRFGGLAPPFLYSVLDMPASEPGGEFDLYRHFVAVGRWDIDRFPGLVGDQDLIGVRDRTWGVRTRRIRMHNWYVFWLGDTCLTLIHQELADGSEFYSEGGAVHADGRVERLRVVGHDLRYDPHTREVIEGSVDLEGETGPLRLEYERVGRGMRLAGAGYDDRQGARETAHGVERDEYDLGDPEVARRTGRGTMDAGARGQVSGAWSAEGIGVVETAIARDHVDYGVQIA
ncbi:MAG: hypothetical protein ACRDK0_14500 [Solirubrobacteraceae bacterium]